MNTATDINTATELDLQNIPLGNRTYRITDLKKDWGIDDDELFLDAVGPIITNLFAKSENSALSIDKVRQNLSMNIDIGLLYDLIVRQKKHRNVLALMFRPVNGDAIDESVSLEERMQDVGKLKNVHLVEGLKRFFAFVTKSPTEPSLTSSNEAESPHSD
jgi:hypothetical protein